MMEKFSIMLVINNDEGSPDSIVVECYVGMYQMLFVSMSALTPLIDPRRFHSKSDVKLYI